MIGISLAGRDETAKEDVLAADSLILGSDVLVVVQSHKQSLNADVCTRKELLTFRVGRQDEDGLV